MKERVPIMCVRVDAPRAHGAAVLALLRDACVGVPAVEPLRQRVVLRAEVPMPRLAGLQRGIGTLTQDSAPTMCWLLRYEEERPSC